jgi:hypothetical protein
MSESNNNNKNLIVVVLALIIFLTGIYLTKTLPKDQPQEPQKVSTYDTETQKALNALETYYSLLAQKDYANAVNYHGSGYGYILSLNPTVDEAEHELLLEVACESNGFICMEISEVISSNMDEEGIYTFIVSFKNKDGELHVLPAMKDLGLNEEITDHSITVVKSGDLYKVSTPLIFYP